ncbi:hypothetical protein [Avibacterium paragallinarum]|nr:hypothetical protein [Avibacterium paragallinarum]WAM59047.1 hypothetical protein OW731_11075 [Avibacterium paragallinarum]
MINNEKVRSFLTLFFKFSNMTVTMSIAPLRAIFQHRTFCFPIFIGDI